MLKNFKSVIVYLGTHLYFYVIIFLFQCYIVLMHIIGSIFVLTKCTLSIIILKLFYLLHGFFGMFTIVEDYVFNRFMRYIIHVIMCLIVLKIFFFLVVY
jgi:succinate dehydrogenase hydrophobic anchor subunit